MSLKDVLDGFDRLANSLREVNISKSIGEAQSQVEQLKANEGLNEFDQIKAQRAIAQATGARVMQLGGNAFAAQQAMQSLAPQPVDMQMAQLEATGESTVGGAMGALERKKKAEEDALNNKKFKQDIKKIEVSGEESRKTAAAKAANTPKVLPKHIDKTLTDIDMRRVGLKQLLTEFQNNPKVRLAIGPSDGRWPDMLTNSEGVAFRRRVLEDFNEYRRIVTGAAASIPELKSLKPAALDPTDTEANFEAKAKDIIESGERLQRALVARAKKRGFDVAGFEGDVSDGDIDEPLSASPSTTPPSTGVVPGLTITKKKN